MNKPKWLNQEIWAQFLGKYADASGIVKCMTCDATSATARMSVDHIKPRVYEGMDALHNIQPMCIPCNSRKNKNADAFWSSPKYFDRSIDHHKLRASQYDYVMGPVQDAAEFFARPWSMINGKLFSYVQIVGAGKTLGMFALPFALNRAVNDSGEGCPRVSKMLIVTKDTALRDQIAREMEVEPVQFGIVDEAPRVEVINSGDKLTPSCPEHDIAVMCPNMLWPQANKDDDDVESLRWSPNIDTVLKRYDVILFDEMHYAHKNIRHLVQRAHNQLVFGFTASPITANGDLLDDMVLMGQPYGYREAIINDQSMKAIW